MMRLPALTLLQQDSYSSSCQERRIGLVGAPQDLRRCHIPCLRRVKVQHCSGTVNIPESPIYGHHHKRGATLTPWVPFDLRYWRR